MDVSKLSIAEINSLTAKPAKNWDALVKIALTALVSGLVGWALSKIL